MSEPITPVSPPLPLADIHLPAAPGLFPLAYGWWLVFFVALLLLGLLFYFSYRALKARKAQKAALKALQNCQSIAEINSLLKRAALSYFPREEVAQLTGKAWLSFLDDKLTKEHQGFVAMQEAWIAASFSAENASESIKDKAQKLAQIWLKKALPAKKRKESTHV